MVVGGKKCIKKERGKDHYCNMETFRSVRLLGKKKNSLGKRIQRISFSTWNKIFIFEIKNELQRFFGFEKSSNSANLIWKFFEGNGEDITPTFSTRKLAKFGKLR